MENQTQVSPRKEVVEKSLTVIAPTEGWIALNLVQLWEYRELIWYLAWRDILARYKQTILGVTWAIMQPLMSMVVFTIVFGRLAKIPSDGLRYSVFCLAGTLIWQYFSSSTQSVATSIQNNAAIVTKVAFPRLIIPVSCIIFPLIDFFAGLLVLFVVMFHDQMSLSWRFCTAPIFILLAMSTALGIGLWLAALTIEYRDIHHILPFFMQLAMFASPVVYSSSLVPQNLRPLFGINPIAGAIAGFRWAVFGTPIAPGPPMLILSMVVALVILVTGAYYFRRTERTFADYM
jgi:lipopolysaccharide transport system permease protein